MLIPIPPRRQIPRLWAVPLIFTAMWIAYLWSSANRPGLAQDTLWLDWGAPSGGFIGTADNFSWGSSWLRLFTALFLHADWVHLLGNLIFLLIFGLPAERQLGSWRLIMIFLCGGALANLATILTIGSPNRVIIGASGAVSAVIGTYLTLFPSAKLGVAVPLGLFLEFIRIPAPLLIGLWALLQLIFVYIGPIFGHVAWSAHLSGLAFGISYGWLVRSTIAKRLRKQHGY